MEINKKKVQEKLEHYLNGKGISQAEFAESIGMSRQSLSNAFSDKQRLSEDFFLGIMFQYPDLNLYQLFNPDVDKFSMTPLENGDLPETNQRMVALASTLNSIKKLIEKSQL